MHESDSPSIQMTDLDFFKQLRAKNYVLHMLLITALFFFFFFVPNYIIQTNTYSILFYWYLKSQPTSQTQLDATNAKDLNTIEKNASDLKYVKDKKAE